MNELLHFDIEKEVLSNLQKRIVVSLEETPVQIREKYAKAVDQKYGIPLELVLSSISLETIQEQQKAMAEDTIHSYLKDNEIRWDTSYDFEQNISNYVAPICKEVITKEKVIEKIDLEKEHSQYEETVKKAEKNRKKNKRRFLLFLFISALVISSITYYNLTREKRPIEILKDAITLSDSLHSFNENYSISYVNDESSYSDNRNVYVFNKDNARYYISYMNNGVQQISRMSYNQSTSFYAYPENNYNSSIIYGFANDYNENGYPQVEQGYFSGFLYDMYANEGIAEYLSYEMSKNADDSIIIEIKGKDLEKFNQKFYEIKVKKESNYPVGWRHYTDIDTIFLIKDGYIKDIEWKLKYTQDDTDYSQNAEIKYSEFKGNFDKEKLDTILNKIENDEISENGIVDLSDVLFQ